MNVFHIEKIILYCISNMTQSLQRLDAQACAHAHQNQNVRRSRQTLGPNTRAMSTTNINKQNLVFKNLRISCFFLLLV